MGVDYYTCDICGYNFPDCGEWFNCECGGKFCSTECGEPDYSQGEDYPTCCICRKESLNDSDMVAFLLKHFNLTHEQAMELYRENTKADENESDTEEDSELENE